MLSLLLKEDETVKNDTFKEPLKLFSNSNATFVTIDAIHVCMRFEDVNGSRCKFLAMSWISLVRNEEDTKLHR